MTALSPTTRSRIAAIDVARGVAIVAMIIYHFTWDLAYLGFVAFDPTQSLPWVVFQKAIAGTFIFLTGVSLVLAHGAAIRWPAFWRRFAFIAGAALLVTIGTFAFSSQTFVYFGVLHAIAAFGLMGLAFLRLPLALVAVLAVVIIGLPLFVQSPVFGEKLWSWIGLWDVPPPSEDLVPLFPWFGVALAGIAATRWALASGLASTMARYRAEETIGALLARLGRWSLIIYLLHQPILIGALTALSAATGTADARRAEGFVASCEASCGDSAGDAAYCTAYCACALDRVEAEDLWSILEAGERTPEQEALLIGLTNQCAIEALDPGLLAPDQE
ncbi:DUF1624 domain-containing protein [Pelagibacterium lacus]|uniref:DUF1624 domain-containing protein n=1 Tax=Pelagibacterium lacus TaxID=2282655 RepID=A0A369W5D2_9HYPH|nr:heparan-alpha-glucosaminide N-acetyltransferase [Pelagibacterium lacus]RDE09876.1 DUF1624 domain-containing protein [Pelagibacterium lacus]